MRSSIAKQLRRQGQDFTMSTTHNVVSQWPRHIHASSFNIYTQSNECYSHDSNSQNSSDFVWNSEEVLHFILERLSHGAITDGTSVELK